MKTYPIFLIAVLIFFIMPAYAFEDDFNDGDITDWSVTSGAFSASGNALRATTTGTILHSISSSDAYFEVDVYPVSTAASGGKFCWVGSGTSCSKGLNFESSLSGGNHLIVTGIGFTMSTVTLYGSEYKRFKITLTDSQVMISYYYASNDTLIGSQQVAYTPSTVNNAFIYIAYVSSVSVVYIDNVYTAEMSPNTESSITAYLDSYTVNSTVQINWIISNNLWTWYNTFDVEVLRNGVELTDDTFDVGSQTGVYFYRPSQAGSYELKLRKYYLGIFSSSIATDTFTVYPEGQSSLMVASEIPVGKNFNLNYTYGFTPDCGSNMCIIKAMHQNADLSYTYEKAFPSTGTLAGTMYSINGNVNNEGTYVFQFYYGGRLLDSKTATASYIYIPGQISLSASFINFTNNKTSYAMGEVMTGDFGADNANYSNYTIYLEFYNWDKLTNTTDVFCNPSDLYGLSFPCDQVGSFSIDLTNTFYGSGGNEQLSKLFFISGQNKLSLMGKNTSASIELAFKNFTLGATNEAGYGLVGSSNSVCIGSPVRYQVITPGPATVLIMDGLFEVANYSLNGSQVITYVPTPTIGIYGYAPSSEVIQLLNSNGYIEASANLEVKPCGVGATPAPTMSGEATVSFLSSTDFLAIIIFLTIVGLCATMAGAVGLIVGVLAVIPVMYIGGLIPLWIVFLDAGIIFLGCAVMGASYLTKVSGK